MPGANSSGSIDSGVAGSTLGEAKARSRPKTVRPIEPKGTSPISTCRAESRSQSSEPMPMPSVNTPSSRVTLVSVPPSTFFA